jgi:hypothetical protein
MIGSIAECHADCIDDDDGDPDLDWCVDRRPSLCAMSTAEVWAAAVDGRVDRDMRAWRIGLECWTRLAEIPELAGAFEPYEPEPVSDAAVTPPAVEITSLPMRDTSAGATSPVVWGGAAWGGAAAVVSGPEPLPQRYAFEGRLRGALVGARWIAAGCAIAVASLGLSLLHAFEPEPRPVVQASVGLTAVRAVSAAVRASSAPRLSAVPRVAAPPRAEPGQRRLRGGRGKVRVR